MNLIKHLFTKHLATTLIVGLLVVAVSSYISYFVKADSSSGPKSPASTATSVGSGEIDWTSSGNIVSSNN